MSLVFKESWEANETEEDKLIGGPLEVFVCFCFCF